MDDKTEGAEAAQCNRYNHCWPNMVPYQEQNCMVCGVARSEVDGQEKLEQINKAIEKANAEKDKPRRFVFPTMLRKMWSGGEVQKWLDENVNAALTPEPAVDTMEIFRQETGPEDYLSHPSNLIPTVVSQKMAETGSKDICSSEMGNKTAEPVRGDAVIGLYNAARLAREIPIDCPFHATVKRECTQAVREYDQVIDALTQAPAPDLDKIVEDLSRARDAVQMVELADEEDSLDRMDMAKIYEAADILDAAIEAVKQAGRG
ncbi:hypothetical protein [Methylobacterium oryzae]|uniref:hypothetical protein n=1 Tax=Methylobacterium oryzae TaxID=334852 RepID=UPI002F356989